ncbi:MULTISPECIES: TonB-dependent receptor [Methylotenera]|uniref:TonB-dependent receptor n=1 Tax=Methylotenera TaxID=359407 RepID=UPI0003722A6C|nr:MULTISPECIES: TonB-dependent receptor [Methylotenera]
MHPQLNKTKQNTLPAYFKHTTLAILLSSSLQLMAAEIDIPAQPLDKALNTLAKQSGERIVFSTDLTEKITAPAVKGNLNTREALDALLKNSGLILQGDAAQGFTVIKKPITNAQTSEETLPEVAVSATAAKLLPVTEPGTLLIDTEALARNNPSDVRGVFNGQPSVKVGGSTPMSQKVYVNGIEETNLAVTIDGSRQNNKVFHHNGTTLIDPIFLKAVSVNAGVAPSDAGPGAIAGSIAYETRNARDFLTSPDLGAYIRSSFNTNGNIFSQTLAGYGASEQLDGLAYLTVANGNSFEAGNGDKVDGTGTDLVSGYVKLGAEAEGGHRLQLSHERVRDDAARPFRGNIGFITGRPAWEPRVRDYEMIRDNTVLRYFQDNPEQWWNPNVVLAYSKTEITVPIFTRGGTVVFPGSGETGSFNGKFENKFPLDIGSITAGVDFYRDKADYKDPTYQVEEKASNKGAYVQARINPWQPLQVSAGVRGDHHRLTGTQGDSWSHSGLSSNASGELAIVPELLTVKAGFSHVFSGSQMAENFIMNTDWNYGNGPKPTKADNYFFGLETRYHGFSAEAKVFETRIENARVARFAVNSANLASDVRSRGYELGIGYQWEQSYVRARFADIDVTINGTSTDSDAGNYLATPAGEILYLTAGHHFPALHLTVGGDAELAQKYNKVSNGTLSFPSYEVFNLFAEYQPAWSVNTKLRLDVRNIFDDTYADRATYQGFGTVTPLYQAGRSLLLSVSATF